MFIFEMMRSGDLHMLSFLFLSSLIIFTPITLLVGKIKNRLTVGSVILCFIPMVNVYVLFFFILMRKLPKQS